MGKDKGAAANGAAGKPQTSLLGFLQRKQPVPAAGEEVGKQQRQQQRQEEKCQQTPPQGQEGTGPANGGTTSPDTAKKEAAATASTTTSTNAAAPPAASAAAAAAASQGKAKVKWMRPCAEVLCGLLRTDEEGWFSAPVDPVELEIPDYLDVIERPMDLGTVQATLVRGGYTGPEAFAADCRLVFRNAVTYNESPEHPVHQAARQMAADLEARLAATGLFAVAAVAAVEEGKEEERRPPRRAAAVAGERGRREEEEEGQEEEIVELVSLPGSPVPSVASLMAAAAKRKRKAASSEPSEGNDRATTAGAAPGPVHPFFSKRRPASVPASASPERPQRGQSDGPAEGTGDTWKGARGSKRRRGMGKEEKENEREGAVVVVEKEENERMGETEPGGKQAVDLTDEELLTGNTFFFTKEQRKRRAELLRLQHEEMERQRRREELASFNAGRELHPFFQEVKAQAAAAAQQQTQQQTQGGGGEDGGDSGLVWTLPPFPVGYSHVLPASEGEAGGGDEPGGGAGDVPSFKEAGDAFLRQGPVPGAAAAEGEEGRVVVDLEAEEADDVALRQVMLWRPRRSHGGGAVEDGEDRGGQEGVSLRRLLALVGPWTGTAEEAVAALAAAAGEDIEMDGPTGVRAQLAWMKENARAARAAAGGALWVDQYRPTDPDKLLWDLRGQAARAVQRWLKDWQTWRQSGFEEAALKAAALAEGGDSGGGGKKKKEKRRRREEEEEDEEGEEDGCYSDATEEWGSRRRHREPRSTMLVTGPPGSGKTALCYAAAQRGGFEVIEINATQLRSGAEIKKLFGEATQSRHITNGGAGQPSSLPAAPLAAAAAAPSVKVGKKQKKAGGRGGKGKGGGRRRASKGAEEEEEEEQEDVVVVGETAGGGKQGSPQQPRMTLILIEEVDLVFEEDAGFHRALRELMATAKWPLLLIANAPPRWLQDLAPSSFHHIRVAPAPTAEVALLLAMVWAAEGLPALPPPVFMRLAATTPGDVRAALMNLQAWAPVVPGLMSAGKEGVVELVVMDEEDEEERGHQEDAAASAVEAEAEGEQPKEEEEKGQEQPQQPPQEQDDGDEEEWRGDDAQTAEAMRALAAAAAQEAAEDAAALVVLGARLPFVKRVQPCSSGKVEGGERLRVTGRGFLQRAVSSAGGAEEEANEEEAYLPVTVLLGHVPCSDVLVLSDTELIATAPACSSSPRGEGGPRAFPVVVRVGRYAASAAARPGVTGPVFRYRVKGVKGRMWGGQRRIDDLFGFPPLCGGMWARGNKAAARGRGQGGKGRGGGKGGRRLVRRPQDGGEKEEEEDLVLDKGAEEAAAAAAVMAQEEQAPAAGQEGNPKGSKRRRIMVDDEEEDEEGGGEELASPASVVPSNQPSPGEGGEEAAFPPATAAAEALESEAASSVEGGAVEEAEAGAEKEESAAEEGSLAAASSAGKGPVACDEEEEEEEAQEEDEAQLPVDVPARVWRDVLRPPPAAGSTTLLSSSPAVLQAQAESAEALSCRAVLCAVAPQLDGDDYAQCPAGTLGQRASDAEDDEVSPWPRVPSIIGGPPRALEALAACYQRQHQLPAPSITAMCESKAESRRELAWAATQPLLPPSAALPFAHRLDVHLDYAPMLRAMQRGDEAHALAEAAGQERVEGRPRRSLRRAKERQSYWCGVYPEGYRELQGLLQQLALSGLGV